MRLVTAPNAEVIRDAQQITISSDKIVLDDILILSSGKQISADAIVRSGVVEVNESLLTGEAIAVKRRRAIWFMQVLTLLLAPQLYRLKK